MRAHEVASVVVLDASGAQVLLVRDPATGSLRVPTTHVEGGERHEEAARRLLRDIGIGQAQVLDPRLGLSQDQYACLASETAVRHVDHCYAAAYPSDPAAWSPPRDSSVAWVDVATADAAGTPGTAALVRAGMRQLAAHGTPAPTEGR